LHIPSPEPSQTEKFNGTLLNMISNFVQEQLEKWYLYLNYMLFAYNTAINDTTKNTQFYQGTVNWSYEIGRGKIGRLVN